MVEGAYCFFDPKHERIEIILLTASEKADRLKNMVSCEAVENEDERSINNQRELPRVAPSTIPEV